MTFYTSGIEGPLAALKITVIDQRNSVCHHRKVSPNNHYGQQYLNITTFTNFNSFATSSKRIFDIVCIRQVKQTRSTTGTLGRQLGIPWWSVII